MGLDLKQLQKSLGIVKDYSDKELSDAERRIEILIESLYEVIKNEREDPLRVLDDNTGIEDNPIGHIMTFMGTKAPRHYLVCDGSELNIADYPMLSQHMFDQFGSINYFGGDGTTTFKVPDLRGEFLRGAGANSRGNQGSGTSVGKHQDATNHQLFNVWAEHRLGFNNTQSGTGIRLSNNEDTLILVPGAITERRYANYNHPASTHGVTHYTSRPTSTSVLYCIKYEPTYYIRTGPDAYHYKAEETRVGTWKDGLPLYRQILEVSGPFGKEKMVPFDIGPASTSKIVSVHATIQGNYDGAPWGAPVTFVNTGRDVLNVWLNQGENMIHISTTETYISKEIGTVIVEVLYTKTA